MSENCRGVSRRTVLFAAAGAMPALGLMGGVAQAKMAQAAVHYQADPKDGKRCDGCNFFIAPNGCKMVVGDIAPTGWCSLWVKKAGSATAAPRPSRHAPPLGGSRRLIAFFYARGHPEDRIPRLHSPDELDAAAMARPGTVVRFEDQDSPVAPLSVPVSEGQRLKSQRNSLNRRRRCSNTLLLSASGGAGRSGLAGKCGPGRRRRF
jgi:hypothetical protein